MDNISLISINKEDEKHIEDLYHLLKKRKHNISNLALPTFNEHRDFVLNHPYRFWYLVKKSHSLVGSVYLNYENVIGLNLFSSEKNVFIKTIKLITKLHDPLPPIKSVRSKNFIVNVNPNNKTLINALKSINFIHIQNTYLLEVNQSRIENI